MNNTNLDLKLFEQIMNIPSPTGYTNKIISFLEEYIKGLGYKTYKNKKGNLIVEVKG